MRDVAKAIDQATKLAAEDGTPCTVWRHGEHYLAVLDNVSPESVIQEVEHPIRPVVIVDPDGTQHE